MTAANQHEPWLMFEAGALAKHLDVGHVVPLCLDLAPADVTGPLEAFQGWRLDESGMRKLVQDMVLRDKPYTQAQIDRLFQAMWPELELQVREAEQQSPVPRVAQRNPQEMLEELVERVRRIEREQTHRSQGYASVSGPRFGGTASARGVARVSDEAKDGYDVVDAEIPPDRPLTAGPESDLARSTVLFSAFFDGQK